MKILVIDDSAVHLDAAKQTLASHDVTYCATHKEAVDLLSVPRYYEVKPLYWDVVLSDLLMPAGSMEQCDAGLQYVGQEMAVGWSLVLQAAKNGAKYVAVVTDTSHHYHPASAMLDHFNRHFFTIDGARVLMTNYVDLVGIAGTEATCIKCGGSGKEMWQGKEYSCYSCDKGQAFAKKGKDWGKILEQLLKGPSQE